MKEEPCESMSPKRSLNAPNNNNISINEILSSFQMIPISGIDSSTLARGKERDLR